MALDRLKCIRFNMMCRIDCHSVVDVRLGAASSVSQTDGVCEEIVFEGVIAVLHVPQSRHPMFLS